MMRLALAIIGLCFALWSAPVAAQGCGQANPNCIVPTAPTGTSNNQAASTAFVQQAAAAAIGTPVQLACNGTTDDGATIQAAINGLPVKGGNILLWTAGASSCNLRTALTNDGKPNVTLTAQGLGNVAHQGGSQLTQCAIPLVWNGSGGATMITFTAPVLSGSNNQWLLGGGLQGVCLFGNSLAAYDLVVASQYHGLYSNIYLDGATTADIELTDDASLSTDIADDQFDTFSNIYISAGTVANSIGLLISYTTSNPSFVNFFGLDINFTTGGTGIKDVGGDNNHFYGTRVFRNAGSGPAVDLSINSTLNFPADSETFYGLSTNAPIIARGTSSFPGKTATYGNTIYGLDKGNATPDPTIESGATIAWFDSDGRSYFQNLLNATLGANVNSTGYLYLGNYNCAAVYPAASNNWGICSNFSGAQTEVDFFNTNKSATDCYRLYQLTGTSAATLALDILCNGTLEPATPLGAVYGGSGQASPTAHAVLLGEGSSAFGLATIGTGGRLFVDQGSGADPAWKALSADCSITAAGAITCLSTNGTLFGNLATANANTGLTKSGTNLNSNAESTNTFSPGLATSVSTTKGAFTKWVKASTVDNLEGSASSFTCSGNPTVTFYECGTSTTCGTPTTIGSATVTAAGTVVDGTVSNPAITAGDYTAWAVSAGTCTALDAYGTAQVHSN